MKNLFPDPESTSPRDPVARLLAGGALLAAVLALVLSTWESAPAEPRRAAATGQSAVAKLSARIGKLSAQINKQKVGCPVSNAVDFGTWCLEASTYRVPPADAGKNDYLYATQTCAKEGGWLPTAAQLIGAAPKAPLQSTIDDDPATSGTEEFPEARRGIKDKREMTADLFTVSAGAIAAGSEGVSVGAKGNAQIGEPDPVPIAADPVPNTLNYVTVYDNHNVGGFAGGEPVGVAENFRCAYAIGFQGHPKESAGS